MIASPCHQSPEKRRLLFVNYSALRCSFRGVKASSCAGYVASYRKDLEESRSVKGGLEAGGGITNSLGGTRMTKRKHLEMLEQGVGVWNA